LDPVELRRLRAQGRLANLLANRGIPASGHRRSSRGVRAFSGHRSTGDDSRIRKPAALFGTRHARGSEPAGVGHVSIYLLYSVRDLSGYVVPLSGVRVQPSRPCCWRGTPDDDERLRHDRQG
jgi:hypothetical protein